MNKDRIATWALLGLSVAFCALLPLLAAGALNTYDGLTYTTLLAPSRVAGGANTTGTATDVSSAQGIATFVLAAGCGEDGASTNTVWIEHCATSGGTYGALTNSAGTAVRLQVVSNVAGNVSAIKCDMGIVSSYVRAVHSAVADTGTASAVLIRY